MEMNLKMNVAGSDYAFEGLTYIDGGEFLTFHFIDTFGAADFKKVLFEVVSIIVLEMNEKIYCIGMGNMMMVHLMDDENTSIGFLELSDNKLKIFLSKKKYALNNHDDTFDDVFSEISDMYNTFF